MIVFKITQPSLSGGRAHLFFFCWRVLFSGIIVSKITQPFNVVNFDKNSCDNFTSGASSSSVVIMAASLGKTIQAEILDSTEAENAFEPFWDKCKKYLIYGLVIGGLVLIPTGLMTGALNCSKCHSEIQSCQNFRNQNPDVKDKLNPQWKFQSAFCTYNSVHAGVYYLPLILFAMALVLLAIDKVFDVLFKSGPEIQSYYQLVQKELGEKNEMSSDVNR